MEDERITNDQAKKIFKILEDMGGAGGGSKNDYSKLTYKSCDNVFFDFNRSGPLSCFYLRLMNRNISINNAKVSLREFKNRMDRLIKKKTGTQKNNEDFMKNAKALYNGLSIITIMYQII